jgi:DNA-binding MarR family transcriptional regulator
MQGQIDSSFTTEQRDLFASGFVAEIGVNAYAVWHAIKFYADFNTGEAFPGMRTIGKKLGISQPTVARAVAKLEEAHLLRVERGHSKRRGQTYIARERMAIRLGNRLLCTVVIDYVPNTIRQKVNRLSQALASGEDDPDAFAQVDIIPGEGFAWDDKTKMLRAAIPVKELPRDKRISSDEFHQQIGMAMLERLAPNAAKAQLKK